MYLIAKGLSTLVFESRSAFRKMPAAPSGLTSAEPRWRARARVVGQFARALLAVSAWPVKHNMC